MQANIHQQKIIILDFGSQYTQLIARRVREMGVYCEIHPFDISDENLKNLSPRGIILSGGPETVTMEKTPRAPQIAFDLACPVLGICYGMQTMAAQLGGEVQSSAQREFGHMQIKLCAENKLFQGIQQQLDVWMSHGDRVVNLPPQFTVSATSTHSPIAAMADEQRHFYGVQFHPEVTHTQQGYEILSRFINDICGCTRQWTAQNILQDLVERLREQVGKEKVILGLSGGVDSSVVAALLHRAIGAQLHCVFIDTGFLRLHEAEQVKATMGKHLGINLIAVDAGQQFISALKNARDPEAKRKIFGKIFIDLFQEQAKQLGDAKWLAQGTIYPDVIESAASKFGKAHVIKSHHNVGGLPEKMDLKLLEPLRELFKDEVRQLGLQLGLPKEMVYRHPFPGPGLGVRILGEIQPEFITILQQADDIFISELRKAGWYDRVSQAFAVFLPVKAVGVMGDARKYDYVIALRAVETTDFMTAQWSHLPYELLATVSNRIMNEVNGVARVVYDISSKPPATIEWE